MKTPYDAALRALEHEMDALKRVIGAATQRLDEMQSLHEALEGQIVHEQKLATLDHMLFADAYLARARNERAMLNEQRCAAEAELAELRDKAAEQYASIRAVGNAADRYREEAERARDRAEQQLVDDVVAARFVRSMRHARDRKRLS
ncbi:hypothetical protein KY084_06075 [Stakelama sp. CBK3Z-3]|uniref:Flagellar FliJ protein n=1 Tax=Stakelama flava TaxID=2860338 RepID=A0ABS6XJR2_9SPHN|nr:hypothetical protein [Stakelama flava]MBW4330440.1 hypothetical protein [Stakelama flava]